MTNIKIKGLSLIILLTILIFSNTEVFADDGISNESLDKLKEKEHLYYEDFDALKTENSFIYVIDKNSGETVYPQRIKNEDLIELEEKLSMKKITDFNRETFSSYYEKYIIYNLASNDGTEYIIFLENTRATVIFKSNDTPYLLFIEGERVKVSTYTYEFILPKGKVYKVKAEYDDSLKEIELDLTNPEINTLEHNLKFDIPRETKGYIAGTLVIALIIVLFVLFLKHYNKNKVHQ